MCVELTATEPEISLVAGTHFHVIDSVGAVRHFTIVELHDYHQRKLGDYVLYREGENIYGDTPENVRKMIRTGQFPQD